MSRIHLFRHYVYASWLHLIWIYYIYLLILREINQIDNIYYWKWLECWEKNLLQLTIFCKSHIWKNDEHRMPYCTYMQFTFVLVFCCYNERYTHLEPWTTWCTHINYGITRVPWSSRITLFQNSYGFMVNMFT